MVKSILVGILLTATTVVIHAVGTSWWLQRLGRLSSGGGTDSQLLGLRVLCSTATLLLTLHILEVVVWAMVLMCLPGITELGSVEKAVYFSTVTYSSLGYGDVVIGTSWRLLAAIESMAGLLVFGWSTAMLFAVVQRLWGANSPDAESGS